MKILHITERFGASVVGGAQQSVEDLAMGQHRAGNEVGVICAADNSTTTPPDYPFPVWQVPLGASSALLRQTKLSRYLALACHLHEGFLQKCHRSIEPLMAGFRPDVVNTHILTGISDAVWATAQRLRLPVVHTLRDFYLLCARSSMYKADSACLAPCLECEVITHRRQWLAQQVRGFVGISDCITSIHKRLRAIPATAPTRVIPNSVSWTFDPPFNADQTSGAPFIVGFLGRLVRTKGIEQLIQAFQRASISNSELRIAGEGAEDYVRKLKASAGGDRIAFVGRVNAREFIAKCSVIAIPSLWEEPFGRVIAESLMSNVPVICSDRGAFPEIIGRFAGGLTTHPEDNQRFASDLVRLHANWHQLRTWLQNNRASIASHFSTESMVRSYLDFYTGIVEASARS